MKYSIELISEFKKTFKEEGCRNYTDEEANDALDNMAKLFLSLGRTRIKSDESDTKLNK